MDEGLINYIKTYENYTYICCLSADYTDYTHATGGEVVKRRVFDEELWNEHPDKKQIEEEYQKFKSGTFEDEALTNIHRKL